jgi:hypothetical protein
MRNVPSIDLASVRITDDAPIARALREYTTEELKAELLRRGNVDFSKWDVAIKMGPILVVLLAIVLWKLGKVYDGSMWSCLFT